MTRVGGLSKIRALARKLAKEEETAETNRRQAQNLARKGRGGDSEIAHVTPGEIVIPQALQTPEVMDALAWAASSAGLNLDRLRIGARANSINPKTGAPEFRVDDMHKYWQDAPPTPIPLIEVNGRLNNDSLAGSLSSRPLSTVASNSSGRDSSPGFLPRFPRPLSLCDHGFQGGHCEGWIQDFLKDKPLDYMPTVEDLARMPAVQREEYARFYDGLAGGSEALGAPLSLMRRLYGPLAPLFGRKSLNNSSTYSDISNAYRGKMRK